MEQPILPFWFKQRQCRAEPAGAGNIFKVIGPNLGESYVLIDQAANNRWLARLRSTADGPDVAYTEPQFDSPQDAWEAAFELYRTHVIV